MDKQHLPPQYHLAAATPYQNTLIVPTPAQNSSAIGILQPTSHPNLSGHQHHHHHHQLAYQQFHHHAPPAPQASHHQQQQQQIIQMFWANQMQEIENTVEFRNHSLPLARIKKIMKADEDVRMISAEAPVVFAKACEMFIHELTLRSWIHTEESKRRTLQKNDIAAAITRTDIFDFLVDIVPRDELKEVELLGNPRGALPVGATGSANSIPFYFLPQQHSTPRGIVVGKSVDSAIFPPQSGSDPMAYAHQQM